MVRDSSVWTMNSSRVILMAMTPSLLQREVPVPRVPRELKYAIRGAIIGALPGLMASLFLFSVLGIGWPPNDSAGLYRLVGKTMIFTTLLPAVMLSLLLRRISEVEPEARRQSLRRKVSIWFIIAVFAIFVAIVGFFWNK